MAHEFSGKTVYDCDREQWKLQKDGTLIICGDEYVYAAFIIDESGDFFVDSYNPERRYYKMK